MLHLLICENVYVAEQMALKHNIEEWFFVGNTKDLNCSGRVILTGKYEDRHDWFELYRCLQQRGRPMEIMR